MIKPRSPSDDDTENVEQSIPIDVPEDGRPDLSDQMVRPESLETPLVRPRQNRTGKEHGERSS